MPEEKNKPEKETAHSVGFGALLGAEDRTELTRVLSACKTKLLAYRAYSNGEYNGGMEHTALIKLIEDTYTRFCT